MSDEIEILLHQKFRKRHKTKIDGDCGILSATDCKMFLGTQLFYYSLSLSHEIKFAIFDLGLLPQQRSWCLEKDIQVLDLPELIFPDKQATYWQAWNKPVYLQNSPFPKTLWIDADCIVRGSLKPIFEMMESNPFIVEDIHSPPGWTPANKPSLYQIKRFFLPNNKRTSIYLNDGVLGLHIDRDQDIIEKWKQVIEYIYRHPEARESFSWYDQGALLWTLESIGKLDLIRPQHCYNFPGRLKQTLESPTSFLQDLPDIDAATIRHYAGFPKPWINWNENSLEPSINFKVLVLSHTEHALTFVPLRPWLDLINLNDLDIGIHQTNELAESRIYLDSALIERFEGKEYVGLASANWDQKYYHRGILTLNNLYKCANLLSPKVVLAAWTDWAEKDWVASTCAHNQGMGTILEELREFTGLPLLNGPSFWSNNYICHRDVFEECLVHFRNVFDHFYRKYKNRFDFKAIDRRRTSAFFYEAVTVHYFSNRPDLKIKKLVDGNRFKLV